MDQKNISNLATSAGRQAYQDYWHDLIVEQRSAVVPSLWRLWRTAAFGTEIRIATSDTSWRFGHPLGPRAGTRIFMEEIIVRHYYNNVQALVYFGAMILLVFLGLRFAGVLSEEVSLIGIAIEAFMLLILFAVLFYAPEDSPPLAQHATLEAETDDDDEDDREVIREVLQEIEEIGSTYAGLSIRMEQLAKSQEEGLRELNRRVAAIQGLNLLESHAERLETTNTLLSQLVDSIEGMSRRIDMLFGKELEFYVRKEFERMVGRDNADARQERPEIPTGENER